MSWVVAKESWSNGVNEVVDDGDDGYDEDEKKKMYLLILMMPKLEVNVTWHRAKKKIPSLPDIGYLV